MPRVPTYESQILQPTIRQGEARQVITSEQATLPGRQMQEVGETMGRVGSALGQYVLQRQNDLNEAQALDALNQIDGLAQEGLTSYESLQRLDAIQNKTWGDQDPVSFIGGKLRDQADEIINRLNPAVQRYVRPRVDVTLARTGNQLTRHFNAQNTAFQVEVNERRIEVETQNIIRYSEDESAVLEGVLAIRRAREIIGKVQGQDPETIRMNADNAISEAMATTHTGLLNSNNFPAAERFLERNQNLFRPEALVDARSTQRQAGAVFYGRQDADQVLRDIPVTRDDNKASDREAALLALATIDSVVDEDRLDAARTLLNRAVNAAQSDIAANDVRLQDELIALAATNPAEALRRLPTSGLSVTAQEYVRSLARRTTGGAGETVQATPEQYAAYNTFRQSVTDLTVVTPRQLSDLRPQIGEELYGYLTQDITETVRVRRLGESATIRVADLNSLMATLDIDSDDRAAFEVRARQLIGVEQARLGRELTDVEKRAAVLSGFGTNPTVTVGPTNWFGGGQRRQLGLLSDEERAQVVVPSQDRRRITLAINQAYQEFQTAIQNERDPESRQRLQEQAEQYNLQTNPGLVTRAYIRELETGQQITGR
jgi:hypothetical protein